MTSRILLRLCLPLALIAAPLTASASVINFSGLSTVGTLVSGPNGSFLQQGGPVSVGGLTFTSTFSGFGLSVWQGADPSHPVGGTAATSLFEYTAGDTTTITRTGGGAFQLDGIDLTQWGADMPGGPGVFGVTFVGTRTDLTVVSQTFLVARNAGSPILQSFAFSGFSSLQRVTMMQGTFGGGSAFQFNNLVADLGAAASVPEPTTLALFSSGLVVVAARRRFRRSR